MGEFDVLSVWLSVMIVEPLSNFLNGISVGESHNLIYMKTYLAGFQLIKWCSSRLDLA